MTTGIAGGHDFPYTTFLLFLETLTNGIYIRKL
jgi:hypothetical protein